MPRSRINGNFIDKTFSIVANILLRIIPTTSGEKEAFTYYRDGVDENLMYVSGTENSLNRMTTVTDVSSIRRKLCGSFTELLEILKLRRLGSIKPPSIGNKLSRSLLGIILKRRIG
uniref:Photosystem I assembly protein Ycf3 n=1 Tax=Handeliodendron bodinieri TaxID=290952 RepID=A0A7S8FIN0_9ROSI|nr:photosystem I assembly protein Ycf3 [Handeliodendron bodinieri]QPD06602.1 photosystem I assembly protein Ycf3 [Handeliodendron bodinieri]